MPPYVIHNKRGEILRSGHVSADQDPNLQINPDAEEEEFCVIGEHALDKNHYIRRGEVVERPSMKAVHMTENGCRFPKAANIRIRGAAAKVERGRLEFEDGEGPVEASGIIRCWPYKDLRLRFKLRQEMEQE